MSPFWRLEFGVGTTTFFWKNLWIPCIVHRLKLLEPVLLVLTKETQFRHDTVGAGLLIPINLHSINRTPNRPQQSRLTEGNDLSILFQLSILFHATGIYIYTHTHTHTHTHTGYNRRKGPDFGRVFLMLNYTDITQNTYIQS